MAVLPTVLRFGDLHFDPLCQTFGPIIVFVLHFSQPSFLKVGEGAFMVG
jgi:hypothetical protein